jgi:hypothetical protein
MTPDSHPFVRDLRRALVLDARQDVRLALQVAVLSGRGHTNGQIAERLGASITHVNVAAERLRRVRSTASKPLPGAADSAL